MLYVRKPARDRIVTGTGRWAIAGTTADGRLVLDFDRIVRGGEGKVPFRTDLNISNTDKGVTLFYFSGDPDEGNRIYFKKEKQ